jgi:hypothetical protein
MPLTKANMGRQILLGKMLRVRSAYKSMSKVVSCEFSVAAITIISPVLMSGFDFRAPAPYVSLLLTAVLAGM